MANRILLSLLLATYSANLSVTINSNITILLPLSGEKGINGEAQREGILHAFEYLGLLNSSYGGIVWNFIDTRDTNTRPILVFVRDHLLSNLACTIKRDLIPRRNIWIIPSVVVNLEKRVNLFLCEGKKVTNSILVVAKENFKSNNSAEKLKRSLMKKFNDKLTNIIERDAFYAFDAALVTGNALIRMQTLDNSLPRKQFLSNFSLIIQTNTMEGLTGRLEFGNDNKRIINSSIYEITEEGIRIVGKYEHNLKLIAHSGLLKEPATTEKKITARDEHLVISVCAFLVIDLIILLPWILADPIKCEAKLLGKSYKTENFLDEIRQIVDCRSSLQILWICLIYAYKLIQLIIGSMATWKTRHVTLPTLKDAKEIFALIIAVVILGIIAVPLMLADSVGSSIKYAIGSLIAWSGCVSTLSLAFIPKLYLTRKQRSQGTASDANRLLFTESLRRTQANDKPWFMCCSGSGNNMDMYAEEMLSQEIENLNRTIKQKDATIRDLTDRLYFHQYLGKSRQRRSKAPPTAETNANDYSRVTFNRNNSRNTQSKREINDNSKNDFKGKDISPNRDSAFDNISPSSTSTEMGRKEMNDRPTYEKGPIDVEAIEKEANLVKDWVDLHSDFVKFQQSSLTNPKRDLSFEQGPVFIKKSIRSPEQPILRPIVQKPIAGRSPFRYIEEKTAPNHYSMHALQI
ncbi:DgyrCDS8823 [Dimorphilus gyrociliatus]|uniref:DgyrCDS8823 n=1 Tax=Dimorphilus gyrociliatus TaxID=2664684 RepID=A0A7I8VVF3_9ANNE|nr:DgyrCDS8823 [Dimorphilus gyrociliatus]